jgi:hypothetical protein
MNQKSKIKSKRDNVGLTHLPLSAKIFIAIFAYATTKGILYGVLDPFINNSFLIEI